MVLVFLYELMWAYAQKPSLENCGLGDRLIYGYTYPSYTFSGSEIYRCRSFNTCGTQAHPSLLLCL